MMRPFGSKPRKTVSLVRETLRTLSAGDLSAVRGGGFIMRDTVIVPPIRR